MFQDTLTRAEKNLLAAGQADLVVSMRRSFQEAMQGPAIKIIEELLQRHVLACLSDVDPHANIAAEMFVLEPAAEAGLVDLAETEGDADE